MGAKWGVMTSPGPRGSGGLHVDLSPHAVPPLPELRHRIRAVLARESDECVQRAELLATELVSNAYAHGTAPRGFRLRRLRLTPLIRIEVDDGNHQRLPVLGVSRLGRNAGRGLILIDRLAHRWGVTLHARGKTVWAELPSRVPRPAPDRAVHALPVADPAVSYIKPDSIT
jgi:hypothetical protein